MKTRKLTLCAFAAIAALATACNNDELASTDTPKEGITIEATASTPQGGADTRLTHTDGTDKMSIVWATGDEFTVFTGNGTKTNYALQGNAGKATASFTGTWNTAPEEDDAFYAIYPTTVAVASAIPLTFEGQNGTLDGLKNFNYMIAYTLYSDGQLSFDFSHQVAIVKLALTFSNGVTGSASNIGLKATGLNKSLEMNLTTGRFKNKVSGDVTTGANALTIGSDGKLIAYLCVFPEALTDVKAIAKVGNDDYEVDLNDLEIVEGNMYTATVTMKKKAAAITWATGNLVADGPNGAKIGAPTDGGLYFQFGSLVGWAGGATGDGTGTVVDGLASVIKVKPSNLNSANEAWTATGKIWQGTESTVPFTVAGSGSADEKAGIGDPCRYYLKGTWRLPTNDEYQTLFGTTNSWTNGWSWIDSPASATHTGGLTFPASVSRHNSDSSLGFVGTYGFYWSASPNNTNGYNLFFNSSDVTPSESCNRAFGLPVRCVQNASN